MNQREWFETPRERGARAPKVVAIIVLLALIILCFSLRNVVSNPQFVLHRSAIASLDEKQDTALELTAAATGASLLVSMIPGDSGTSVADELAEVASKLSIALAAVFLEKYLLTVFWYLTFGALLPICGFLSIAYVLSRKDALIQVVTKLLLLGVVLCLSIPVSEHISSLIRKTYETSINETIATANEAVGEVSDEMDEETFADEVITEKITEEQEITEVTEVTEETEKKGLLKSIGSSITGAASSASSAVAVMLVLCCGLPIATVLFMVYAVKQIFGLNVNLISVIHRVEREVYRPQQMREERRPHTLPDNEDK